MSQSSSHQNFAGRGGSPAGSASDTTINLLINTTTGNNFDVSVESHHTVDHLKKVISKKLKVNKDKIILLFKERELQDGCLKDNGIVDGSKIVLTPNVETGLLTQRAENTVMQALESLNDSQVNDFLSGKSPLNLSVRLGDHMMLIQLQLSTINPQAASSSSSSAASCSSSASVHSTKSSQSSRSGQSSSRRHHYHHHQHHAPEPVPSTSKGPPTLDITAASSRRTSSKTRSPTDETTDLSTYLIHKQDVENLESIVKSLSNILEEGGSSSEDSGNGSGILDVDPILEQSPIKSLSNLVSNAPIETTPSSPPPDPISANLTSCLCKRLDSNSNGCESHCGNSAPNFFTAAPPPSSSPPRFSSTPLPHKPKFPPTRFRKHASTGTLYPQNFNVGLPGTTPSAGPPVAPDVTASTPEIVDTQSLTATIDNPTLAEASRNLTQTLRKLSKKVFPRGDGSRRIASGAVIESMKHHGKGIYSGTFSGTLNPALQDKNGKPKRDISTIIHILNDLLSAAPHCARNGAKIYFEPTSSAASVAPGHHSKSLRAAHKRTADMCSGCPSSSSKSMRISDPSSPEFAPIHRSSRRRTTTEVPQPSPAIPSASSSYSSAASTSTYTPPFPSLLEMENSKTKYKLDQLRLVMQQKKERREARKLKNAPYSGPGMREMPRLSPTTTSTTTTITAVASPSGQTVPPPATSPSSNVDSIVEEVDTVA